MPVSLTWAWKWRMSDWDMLEEKAECVSDAPEIILDVISTVESCVEML